MLDNTTKPATTPTVAQDVPQPPQTSNHTPKRRKLTLQDAEAVVELVIGSKCSEREACLNLDINSDQWRSWKAKHHRADTFDAMCARMRGAEIDHSMQMIKNCGDGVGMKQPDWRAHAFRLGAIAPERFGAQAGQGAPGPAVNMLTDDSMARLLTMLKGCSVSVNPVEQSAQVIDVQSNECTPAKSHSVPQLKP